MTLDSLLADRERSLTGLAGARPDELSDDRAMLLELATSLQNWPARNVVFKKALDRAAQDLVRMASERTPG